RPVTTCMVFLGLGIFGVLSYLRVPVSLFPGLSYPGLTISVNYPGADADKMEEIITKPIEEAISGIGGMEEISSSSEAGKSLINIEFQKDTDLNFKALEIRERIDLVAPLFPREAHKPLVFRYDPDQRPVMIIILDSDKYDLMRLREIADRDIKVQLENVEGISQIAVSGGKQREIIISCDLQKLTAYGLNLREIMKAIQSNNTNAGIGKIEKNGRLYSLNLTGRYTDLSEIQTLPVSYRTDRIIYVEDVANVSFSYRDEDSASRVNGKENVSLYIYKASLGNVLNISNEVQKNLRKIQLSNVKFVINYNQADSIRKTFLNIFWTTTLGIFLFFSYIFTKKKTRKAGIITLLSSIPAVIIIFIFLFFIKKEFDIIVQSGIYLGICIWFIISLRIALASENEDLILNKKKRTMPNSERGRRRRFIEKYQELRDILNSHLSVNIEIITGSILLLSLTVPLYMLDRDTGESAIILGSVVIGILLFSYLSSLPISLWTRNIKTGDYLNQKLSFSNYTAERFQERLIIFIEKAKPYFSRFKSDRFRLPGIFRNLDLTGKIYRGYKDNQISILVLFLTIVPLGVYIYGKSDKEYFYSIDNRKILGYVELPSGTGFEFTNKTTKKIEEKLLTVPGIEEVTGKIDSGHSFLLISLKPGVTGNDEYIHKIKSAVGNTDPAFCFFTRESDRGKFQEITIDVLGDDLEKLDSVTRDLAKKSESFEGVSEVILRYKPPREELQLIIDREKSAKAVLSSTEIGDFLRLAIQGGVAAKYIEFNKEVDIRVRLSEEFRNSEDSLREFEMKSKGERYVPISEISSRKETKVPLKIFHKNKKRALSFSIRTGKVSHQRMISQIASLNNSSLPENFRIEVGRNMEKIIQNEKLTIFVSGISIFLFLMILSAYFESTKMPLAIFMNLPVPVFFSIITAYWIFGAVSLPVYLALTLLVILISIETMMQIKEQVFRKERSIIRLSLIPIFLLFLPHLLFAKEGTVFLRELECTFFFGQSMAAISIPRGIIYFKDLPKRKWRQSISKYFRKFLSIASQLNNNVRNHKFSV
ncbi:MAG: efflux RND transporter permease subunit, partial [Leptospira sp.]|nr:efflux RND transporter permease subunit [Leptospira sp.]